jgi:hypothetical protein
MAEGMVTFPISIQQEQMRFTPRPASTLVMIEPQLANGAPAGPIYLFGDPCFVGAAPVPLLDCQAARWPASATRARVRVWCHPHVVTPDHLVAVKDYFETEGDDDSHDEAPTIQHVSHDIRLSVRMVTTPDSPERCLLSVTEDSLSETATAGPLWVSLHCPGVVPIRITRQFDADNRVATHRFELPIETREQVLASGRLEITSLRSLQEQGWLCLPDQPLIVQVALGADLLGNRTP